MMTIEPITHTMQLHLIWYNATVFETIQFHFLPFVLSFILLCIMLYTWKWGACVGWKWGGMRLKKPLPPTVHHAMYTRGFPVEAECVVDDRVFAVIREPHIPE